MLLLFLACTPPEADPVPEDSIRALPATEQRAGDPEAGWDVLRYGDYVGSGFPIEIWRDLVGTDSSNLLERTGDNATIPENYTAFDAPNGVRVVGGVNCFACHAGRVDGTWIVGAPNAWMDWTEDVSANMVFAGGLVRGRYGDDSPEWEAFLPYYRSVLATTPHAVAPLSGPVMAFALEEAAAAHREPEDLTWLESPAFDKPTHGLGADPPPLWNVAKKNALYWNGMGRGDQARQILQIGLLGLTDLDQALEIDAQMPDALAFLRTLEPPPFPLPVDEVAAEEGQALFEHTCARCHGTYGEVERYPSLWVSVDEVGTDSRYAEWLATPGGLADWYDGSWFGELSSLEPDLGYVPPPLDGIWASGPYLHNGSVPTVRSLLDSSSRPIAWRRLGPTDPQDLGLAWELAEPGSQGAFDTTLFGYSNQGHTYGDAFSDSERSAVIAYLKTL